MPLLETKGAASAQGFGLSLGGAEKVYIEDVFSTYLYTGNGSTQTITNGINLSGKGGMIWTKSRSGNFDHAITDSTRYLFTPQEWYRALNTNTTAAQWGGPGTTVNSTGYSLTGDFGSWWNESGYTYASWTFRKQPKFFDIVTYTGDGTVGRTITHNLGSTPGCIIVKATNNTTKWVVWHRSGTQSNRYGAFLNDTSAYTDTLTQLWGATGGTPAMTSTSFSVGDAVTTNDYFNTYVAYVFAHDAGGFGLSGTDNVISCGGTALNASGFATVSLGYEPQFVMIKSAQFDGDWAIYDTMRGVVALKDSNLFSAFSAQKLMANSSAAESTATDYTIAPSSTGFTLSATGYAGAAYDDFIYIAIRRGPMKVPTSGTSVFSPIASSGGTSTVLTTGFLVDMQFADYLAGTSGNAAVKNTITDRLRGLSSTSTDSGAVALHTSSVNAEDLYSSGDSFTNTTFTPSDAFAGSANIYLNFRRAPGFFDVVCYTGTGANATWAHNLSAVPQMMIVKKRSATSNWAVYHSALGAVGWILLNSSAAASAGADFWQSTTPTAVNFYTGTNGNVGDSGQTYVAYLFATCAGVSKVGSYTGTGALQTINCGFTGGARFVLIKRTDSTGDWYVYDSARGISSGNDPYLFLNSNAAEVTGTNYVDTTSVGFQVTAAAPAGLNANGGTYIFLAIA